MLPVLLLHCRCIFRSICKFLNPVFKYIFDLKSMFKFDTRGKIRTDPLILKRCYRREGGDHNMYSFDIRGSPAINITLILQICMNIRLNEMFYMIFAMLFKPYIKTHKKASVVVGVYQYYWYFKSRGPRFNSRLG